MLVLAAHEGRQDTKSVSRPGRKHRGRLEGGRGTAQELGRSVSVSDAFAHDLRRHEDQQLVLVVLVVVLLNRWPSTGISPRYGTFLSSSRSVVSRMPPSTTVWPSFDQHLRRDLAGVDRGHVDAAGGHDHLADAVLLDIEIEDDAVVRRDLRRDLERQHRLLERNGGRAARGGLPDTGSPCPARWSLPSGSR